MSESHITPEKRQYISPKTQDHVDAFIAGLGPFTPAPTVVPDFTGDAQLEWHESGADLEVYVDETGVHEFNYSAQNVAPHMIVALLAMASQDRPAR